MRLRFSLLLLIGTLAVSLLGLAVACSSSIPPTGVSPITGIQIRSDTIIAGKGCGTGPTQVYKYVAVVSDTHRADGGGVVANQVRAAAIYDCFSDGLFQALQPSDSGSYDFIVDVYAFNAEMYNAAQGTWPDDGGVRTVPQIVAETDNPTGGHLGERFYTGKELKFTWVTDCFAGQQPGVEVIAICKPLRNVGSDGTIVLPTSYAKQVGDALSCPDPTNGFTAQSASLRALPPPPVDAGDAGSDASADASDASADASDATALNETDAGPLPPTRSVNGGCDVKFEYVPAPANHTIDVELSQFYEDGGPALYEDGGRIPIRRTACRASTTPFDITQAACDPVP